MNNILSISNAFITNAMVTNFGICYMVFMAFLVKIIFI